MPFPLLIAAAAGAAAVAGIGLGVKGAIDMSDAKDKMERAKARNDRNVRRLEDTQKQTNESVDLLGKTEFEILASFKDFSDLFMRIKNRPEFADVDLGDYRIEDIDLDDINQVSVGAIAIVSGLTGAAAGTIGGLAASGATTAAVMALGTASTGTAISTLGGAAATNAVLAWLGGGALAAGGGGMALGTAVLGASTLGVGLLVGGIIFSLAGSNLSDKADEAMSQVLDNEIKIDKICKHCNELKNVSDDYHSILQQVNKLYTSHLTKMRVLIDLSADDDELVDWNTFSKKEKLIVKNTIALVGVLYHMCKVKILEDVKENQEFRKICYTEIAEQKQKGEIIVAKLGSNGSTNLPTA